MSNPAINLLNDNPLYSRDDMTGRLVSAAGSMRYYRQNPIRDPLCSEDAGKVNDLLVKFPWSEGDIPTMFRNLAPPHPSSKKNLVREDIREKDTSTRPSPDCFFCNGAVPKPHINLGSPAENPVRKRKKEIPFAAETAGGSEYWEKKNPPPASYRKDAKRFAWSLVYFCASTLKKSHRRADFYQLSPTWYRGSDSWYNPAIMMDRRIPNRFLGAIPLHKNLKHLVELLDDYWVVEHLKSTNETRSNHLTGETIGCWIQTQYLSNGPSNRVLFEKVLELCVKASYKLPESLGKPVRDKAHTILPPRAS